MAAASIRKPRKSLAMAISRASKAANNQRSGNNIGNISMAAKERKAGKIATPQRLRMGAAAKYISTFSAELFPLA
jgi:hypothetical protein